MESCSECGNRAVAARQYDGHSVLECELCGALAGSPGAVRAVLDARAARERGVDPAAVPLVRVLGDLRGLRIDAHGGGDRGQGVLPFVAFQLVDAGGLLQLENLGKSLQLAVRTSELDWTIELEPGPALTFALRPRLPAPATAQAVAAAQQDLATLARAIERDSRLSWWRHPASG
jgi:hypothetical protein